MPVRHVSPRRRFAPLARTALLTIALSSGLASFATSAQDAANHAAKAPNPTKSFKVPPLPAGSEHVQLQPGMSKKDWHDAYKETGRPKFQLNTVKRVGGTVERD